MFEKIAKIIEGVIGDGFTGEDYDRGWHDAIKRMTNKLADYFKSENRFFDRQEFLKACGFSVEENWKAVPYNDKTQLANQFAVATIVKGGAKSRRVAGRNKTAALPGNFCENNIFFAAV